MTYFIFAFPNCAVVLLTFRRDANANGGRFKVRYTVRESDSICSAPAFGPPSENSPFKYWNSPFDYWNNPFIRSENSFPWMYGDYRGGFDCSYVINATEHSSISLTIWSIDLRNSVNGTCHRDWLLVTGIDGPTALNFNVTHRSCDHLNSSIQLTFPGYTEIRFVFHRDFETTGKTFRIEYTITGYVDNVPTTELLTTSTSATEPVTTNLDCAVGCTLSSDAMNCECTPETSKTVEISVSTEILPVIGNVACDVDCEISTDGTTRDCSSTHSGDAVTSTEINVSGQRGHSVIVISISCLIPLVAVAVCLGAFLLFMRRRRNNRNRAEVFLNASHEETSQTELEVESTDADNDNKDRDTSRHVPLRPLSLSDHEQPSSSNSALNQNDIDTSL